MTVAGAAPRELRVALADTPSTPHLARHAAAEFLLAVGVRRIDDIVLAISELVTNAVRYAGGGELVVRVDGARVRIEVADSSGQPPVRGTPDDDGHRGLPIVHLLSTGWGSIARDGGKVVWCEIDTSSTG